MSKEKKVQEYTVQEIVENGLLPFKARTIRQLIASGRLPARNVGAGATKKRWLVSIYAIADFKKEMGIKTMLKSGTKIHYAKK